jgi:hypothetical protein
MFGLTNLDGLPWADQLRRTSQDEPDIDGKPLSLLVPDTDLTAGTEAA